MNKFELTEFQRNVLTFGGLKKIPPGITELFSNETQRIIDELLTDWSPPLVKFLESISSSHEMSEQKFCDASRQFAQEYAQLNFPESDGPVEDIVRIVDAILLIKLKLCQPIDLSLIHDIPKAKKDGRLKQDGFFEEGLSKYFHAIAPEFTVAQWRIVSHDLFAAKYGGSKIRIKKNPKDQKRYAAKGLTIKEIQEQLGVSRTYAYKLYREVNKTVKK